MSDESDGSDSGKEYRPTSLPDLSAIRKPYAIGELSAGTSASRLPTAHSDIANIREIALENRVLFIRCN